MPPNTYKAPGGQRVNEWTSIEVKRRDRATESHLHFCWQVQAVPAPKTYRGSLGSGERSRVRPTESVAA